uniref:Xylanolytic transcriptional activator regulatory domain-containing protein n=1 Tax=Bionectria ochroleuca TaxID=29856 RepID=A0A0B7KPZ1_BIOOC
MERSSRESHRVRVSRARKIRCTGKQPCELCVRATSQCLYSAPYTRGRIPRIVGDLTSRPTKNERREGPLPSRHAVPRSPLASSDGVAISTHLVSAAEAPSRASPEVAREDLEGHYVGPASGLSFLLRVQERLHHTTSGFTFGDIPLPEFDPTFCSMLSKEDSSLLLQRYFDFTVPVDRFLHQTTLEMWLDEFHETRGIMADDRKAPAKRAILWMVFALAQEHMSNESATIRSQKSTCYFLAANYQLRKDSAEITLADVQARLCQCLWLLSRSRMNHCWSLFGTAARLALAIGLHRKRQPDTSLGWNAVVERECCRRTFWNAYCLDNYLSIALGRPRIFHDDDIDQELPSTTDDRDIFPHTGPRQSDSGQSSMLAPVAYYKLSQVVSSILKDLYSIRPPSTADRCKLSTNYSQRLKVWRSGIPRFLDADDFDTSLLPPILQRQRNVLNLSYWHTIILLNRHFLLSNFAHIELNSRTHRKGPHKAQIEEGIRDCLDAAMNIVGRVTHLIQSGQMFHSFWTTSYFSFSAMVVLYVYAIQQASTPESSSSYLDAAAQCQRQMSDMAEPGSLSARYCLVLEELRLVAMQRRSQVAVPPPLDQGVSTIHVGGMGNVEGPIGHFDGNDSLLSYSYENTMDFYTSPGSSGADIASWIEFESVFPGLGGFDVST